MKTPKLLFIAVVITLCACTGRNQYPKPENALDAGREFIDGCLKGDFEKSAFYMVNDSENIQQLRQIENDYHSKNNADRELYNNASIIINEDATLSDTVHIINYSNSFDKISRKVKVILKDGKWQVDFKYTFNGNL